MKLQNKLNTEAQKTTGRRESEQKEPGGVFAMVSKASNNFSRVWTFVNMLKNILKIKIHPPHVNVEIWTTVRNFTANITIA